MDMKEIRRENLRKWVADHGRPASEKSLFSQLLGGGGSFGERVARRLEREYKMGPGFLDRPFTTINQGDNLALTDQENEMYAAHLTEERRRVMPRADTLEISRYDVLASMGSGIAMPEYENVIERMTVSASWLRSNVKFSNPASLALITAYGDSMEGTFSDGDMLLVDRGVDEVKIDAVYVLALNDELYIKRLQRRPDGTILMISDNKKYDPYVIKNGELDKFRVLGRVLLAWNATKL